MIEVEALRSASGRSRRLTWFHFVVPTGGSFGLVGECGSGKSTVLRALLRPQPRLDRPHVARRRAIDAARATGVLSSRADGVQDPYGSLHPAPDGRSAASRAAADPSHGQHRATHHARPERSRAAATHALPLSAPAFRRAAPAGRDRARADGRTAGAAARRTDQRARRVGAGGGAEPARGAATGARSHLCSGQPQPGRRRPCLRGASA